ncbi:cytochrome P450, partial [Auricularia subglabra TFB-10046 SS5]
RSYFKSNAPFSLYAAGNRLYVLSDPNDIKAVLANSKTLTWADQVQTVLTSAFGLSREGSSRLVMDVPGAGSLLDNSGQFYKYHLAQSDELESLFRRVLEELSALIQPESIPRDVPLWDWTQRTMFLAVTRALYGPGMLARHETLYEDFLLFDQGFYLLAYGLPGLRARQVRGARKRLVQAFQEELGERTRLQAESAALILKRDAMMVDAGMTLEDRATSALPLFWAVHTNSNKAAAYLLQYLFADSTPQRVRAAIQDEVDAAFAGGSDLPSTTVLTQDCPHLDAAVDEVLRLCTSSTSARIVVKNTSLAGKTLYAGGRILMPSRHLHRSEDIWGAHPERFVPDRGRWSTGDVHQQPEGVWRPFGGGQTYCPGRLLARREMMALVAFMLRRMKDVRAIVEHPGPDLQKVSFGVMEPAPRFEDVRLRFDISHSH